MPPRSAMGMVRTPTDICSLPLVESVRLNVPLDSNGFREETQTRAEAVVHLAAHGPFALLARGGWAADDLGAEFPGAAHPADGAFLLTLPPRWGRTGFFIARLRREGR